jgi:hypothetical protein
MTPKCRRCRRNDLVRRSHRSAAETLLAVMFLYPFRCERCDNRFYRFRRPDKKRDKASANRLKAT